MFYNNYCYNQSSLEKAICHICDYEYDYFLNKKNVVGIGFGYKVKNGFYTNKLCIQVFVVRKHEFNNVNPRDLIPRLYKGFLTDVIETGRSTICSLTEKIRPAVGGYVIGTEYKGYGSGTLGCLVTDAKDIFILGNNHSMALSNEAPLGTKIMQPSLKYKGDFYKDVIAILSKYIPINFKSVVLEEANYLDCAIAKVINKSLVSPQIALVGMPSATIIPRLNEKVKKVGFQTELTVGRITSINSTLEILFPSDKTALFKNLILTTNMSEKGDSGALLLVNNDDNYVVGLLMGDNETQSIFNPINRVLKQLNVRIVTYSSWNEL